MKPILAATVLALGVPICYHPAAAKGCLKGAAVGGVAGHVAGHHTALGAMAGCAVGHHEATKHERQGNDLNQSAGTNGMRGETDNPSGNAR